MIIKGEETFFGEVIKTPEEFIEDLCNRLNNDSVNINQFRKIGAGVFLLQNR